MKTYTPLGDFDSVYLILSKISFLGGVPDPQIEHVIPYFETATFEPGEYIARQDEEPSRLHIIKRGSVRLEITAGGQTVTKRKFYLGECFGEAAMLSMVNHTASFVAEEESELIALSRKALSRLRKEDPELFCHLIMNMARDLARKLQYTDELLLRS